MSKRFLITTILLTIIGLAIEIALSGPIALFSGTLDILMMALIVSLLSKLIRKSGTSFTLLYKRNILLIGSIFGAISLIFLAGVGVVNSFPAKLSVIGTSDGSGSLVFVQMSHIGTEAYYKEVNTLLRDYTASGYIVYLEGVSSGTTESQAQFDRTLGVKISSGTYEDIASFIGMKSQDRSILDGVSPSALRSVDLSLDTLVAFIGTGASTPTESPVDLSEQIRSLQSIGQGPLFPYVFRAVLNASLRYTLSTDILLGQLDAKLRDSIIRKRNEHVIDTFFESREKKVVILYGALHFEGMYAHLRLRDPKWNIVSLKPIFPYRP